MTLIIVLTVFNVVTVCINLPAIIVVLMKQRKQ
jgi:hypothetical protein